MFHRCDSVGDWNPTSCSLTIDSTEKIEGLYSLKMTTDAGLMGSMRFERNLDWSEFEHLIFSVYHPGWTNESGNLWVSTDDTNYKYWAFNFAAAWTVITIDLSSAPTGSMGTLDLSNITKIGVAQVSAATPGEDYYFDFFRGRSIDVTDSIIYLKITEEMGMPSFADMKIKGASLDHFNAGLELEIYDKDDVLSWTGRILYPEAVMEGTKVVGKLRALGSNSQFNNVYRKNYTTLRDSDYIAKDIIDNALPKFSYDDEIDNFTLTTKYDMKTKIQKMFNYLSMLERAVIGYLPDREMFFNKYDNLSKGPQIYQGTYNFEEEAVGTEDLDIGFIDSKAATDSNPLASIIATNDGHKKVIKLVCDGDNGVYAYWQHNFTAQTGIKTIEFWMKYIDKGIGTHRIYLSNELNEVVCNCQFNSVDNLFKVYHGDGGGGSDTHTTGATSDTHHRVKIEFNCTTDSYSVWFNGANIFTGENFYNDRVATSINSVRFQLQDGGGANSLEVYVDAWGESWDANYDVGDNLKCWDESTSKIMITSYTPNANRHITRAPVIGAINSLGQVYYVGKAVDSIVQKYGINQLQPWRDSEITNYTEAKQLGDNLLAIYSMDTQMIKILAVGKGHIQVAKTLNMGWAGVFSITQNNFLVTKRVWSPMNDLCQLELTDNILTRKAFNIRVINKFYDDDAQKTIDVAEVPESTVDGTVVEGARHDRSVWRVPEPDVWDFDRDALAAIGDVAATWFDLDLSSIVPVGTSAVLIRVYGLDNAVGSDFRLRKNGQANSFQVGSIWTCMANMPEHDQLKIGVDSDRKIEFYADPKASDWTSLSILVVGWKI